MREVGATSIQISSIQSKAIQQSTIKGVFNWFSFMYRSYFSAKYKYNSFYNIWAQFPHVLVKLPKSCVLYVLDETGFTTGKQSKTIGLGTKNRLNVKLGNLKQDTLPFIATIYQNKTILLKIIQLT